jgi:hypothetical protein
MLIGLFAGLHSEPARVKCAQGEPCVGKGLAAGLWPVLEPMMVYGVLGLVVALVLLTVVVPAEPRSRS